MNFFLRDDKSATTLYPLDVIHFPHFTEIVSNYDSVIVLANIDHEARKVILIYKMTNQPLKRELEMFVTKLNYHFVCGTLDSKIEIKTFPDTFDISDLENVARLVFENMTEQDHDEDDIKGYARSYVGEYLKSLNNK